MIIAAEGLSLDPAVEASAPRGCERKSLDPLGALTHSTPLRVILSLSNG